MKKLTSKYLIIAALIFVIAASICTLAFVLYKSGGSSDVKVNSEEYGDVNENVNIKEDIDAKDIVKNTGAGKLLERRLFDNGYSAMLEYDDENRLVKISYYSRGNLDYTATITYDNNSVTIENNPSVFGEPMNYVLSNNIIIYSAENSTRTLIVNDDGYIVTEETRWQTGGSRHIKYEYHGGNLSSDTIVLKYANGEIYHESTTLYRYDNKKSPFYNDKTPKWLLQTLFSGLGLNNNITYLNNRFAFEYEYDADGFPTKRTWLLYQGDADDNETTLFFYK